MNLCKLTICFEDPFWIGLVETQVDEVYNVARHVFGAEPTMPEIEDFIVNNWHTLKFGPELIVEKHEGKKINPKRLRRIIEKEIAASSHATRRGTKAQQALAEQRELTKTEQQKLNKQQRDAQAQARFEQKQTKRKEKHKGH